MSPADGLRQIADQLREGETGPSLTVREFLEWFGAKRRGYWVVTEIRDALSEAMLETEPDFESAYIDSTIVFSLRKAAPDPEPETQGVAEQAALLSLIATATPSVHPSYADPTNLISKLAAANRPPMHIAPDASIEEAITLMLYHDFSQLPVMINDRDVRGVVSWSSIGTRLGLGNGGRTAQELMDTPHPEIRSDSSLFQAIPIIVANEYVLIRGNDKCISGIVTASDLSLQFQQLAEPYLLLGEIENHIRRIVGDKFSTGELVNVREPHDSREINGVMDLTFGQYLRLLENTDRWAKLKLAIDRVTFCAQLDRVRQIRNDVMHFDTDNIPPDDLDRLRDFARFLQRLQGVGAT